MSKLKRTPIDQTCKNLLEWTTCDLISELSENKELLQVRKMAFQFCDTKNVEIYQVHIVVTRDERDFLKAFEQEEMQDGDKLMEKSY